MTAIRLLIACLAILALPGCLDTDRYPVSGEECGPNDPVQDLTTDNCPPV